MDQRGVSTTLGFVLSLAITTVLISGILVSAGGFVEDERERVLRSELTVVGNQLAAHIEGGDRLVSTPGSEHAVVRASVPDRVAGNQYLIAVNESGSDQLVLSTDNPEVTVTVTVVTEMPVAASTLDGGELRISYDGTTLEVRDD
ncbi:MAG: DUF7266 family protein [Halobacteriota archaeon]